MSKSQQRSRHHRQPDTFGRRPPNIEPPPRILIICEGETEEIYLSCLKEEYKLQTAIILKCSQGGAPDKIVEVAINERTRLKNRDEFSDSDQTWCALDLDIGDTSKKISFNKAVQKAKNQKVELAVSNPCIEYWFILHHEKTTTSLGGYPDAVRRLRLRISDYEKNQAILKTLLPKRILPRTEVAIENAKACRDSMRETQVEEYPNPSTTMHKLIEELNKLKDNKPYR